LRTIPDTFKNLPPQANKGQLRAALASAGKQAARGDFDRDADILLEHMDEGRHPKGQVPPRHWSKENIQVLVGESGDVIGYQCKCD